ncbi:MAG: PAS domain-containing protein [Kiritimatiellaeota bacterium]|nr:PAS domain-containing protein [Kiritimatiellota bacterium]
MLLWGGVIVAVVLAGLLLWKGIRWFKGRTLARDARTLLDLAPEVICTRDRSGRFLLANQAAATLFGVSLDKITGARLADIHEDADEVVQLMANDRQVIDSGQLLFTPQEPVTRLDGMVVWLQTTRIPLPGADAVLCVSTDVTAYKNRVDNLRESEETLTYTLNAIGDGVIVADYEGQVDWMNERAEGLTGWHIHEARGKEMSEVYRIINQETRRPAENPVAKVYREGRSVGLANHTVLIARDGTEHQIADSGAPIRDKAGNIIGVVVVFRDMTEEYARLEQRGFSQKMEAIGQLSGGIAHDFNNMLAGIMGYAELLRNKVGDDPECVAYAEAITQGAMDAANLNGQLLAFARRGRFQTVPFDLHEVITEVLDNLSKNLDPRIGVHTSLKADPSIILGDPRQVRDAIRNLAVNAFEAMPVGGALTITTEIRQIDEAWLNEHPLETCDIKPGSYIAVTVADTGVGIDKPIQKRIFEPFFSTKRVGQGRGMGLAAVYGTVRNHEGAITVESEPGQGSIFTVFLPVAPVGAYRSKAAESASAAPSPAQPRGGAAAQRPVQREKKGHILFVDDDVQIRTVGKQFLEQLGYTVELREDGVTGVEYYRGHWQDIDLVILDMIMRKMGGRETFNKMRAINPSARVLLCTGYTLGEDVQGLLDMGAVGVLQKPFGSTELRLAVEKAMATETLRKPGPR